MTTQAFKDTFDKLSGYPAGVVEEYVVQHPETAKFAPLSVNTVRVVTVYDGKNTNIIYAAFRMGGGNTFVDNTHSGGIWALIDINAGVVDMDAINDQRQIFEKHPKTHEKIKGTVIPYWRELCEMIDQAARKVPDLGYLGWDVAVTENGPLLIEANDFPWAGVVQLPYSMFYKKGARELFKPFE